MNPTPVRGDNGKDPKVKEDEVAEYWTKPLHLMHDIFESDYGALEFYDVEVPGDEVCDIIVVPNFSLHLPPAPIFNSHLTCAFSPHTFMIHCKSGDIKTFVLWHERDYMNGEDVVRTEKIFQENVTVSYEWISDPARANFQFSFIASDAFTRHTIQNLNGSIYVECLEDDKKGTTRILGTFCNGCFISGETLPLIRPSAVFPAGERFVVFCSLSYCVDGTPKNLFASKVFCTPLTDHIVSTEEGLKKAKKNPDLHEKHVFGSQFPVVQMRVFWLTSLLGESLVF